MSNLVCQICGYTHPSMISSSHLKKHGVTGDEYKLQFPGAVLRIQTESSRAKMSTTKTGAPPWNKGVLTGLNEKISLAKKGVPNIKLRGLKRSEDQRSRISNGTRQGMVGAMTNEVKAKLQQSVRSKKEAGTYIPPMLGKSHSTTSRALLSIAAKRVQAERSEKALHGTVALAVENNMVVRAIEDGYRLHLTCNVCSSQFTFTRQIFRPSVGMQDKVCPICHPRLAGRSKQEKDFFSAIKVLDETAVANDRLVLGGKEIDVLIPKMKIGFEYTGLYWHAEKQNPQRKHLLWKQQFAANRGIKLYTVYEDEWLYNRDLVLSRIGAILQKIPKSCQLEHAPCSS